MKFARIDGVVDVQVQRIRMELFGHLTPDELPTLDEQTEMVRQRVVRRHGIDAWQRYRQQQAMMARRKPYWSKDGEAGRGVRRRQQANAARSATPAT